MSREKTTLPAAQITMLGKATRADGDEQMLESWLASLNSAHSRRNGKTGTRLTERAVLGVVKRAAERSGIEAPVSPHWLRHAHASHAIDRGATLPEVQSTLGHSNIATTSGYLHARPESSSGLKLDPGVFLR